MSPARAGPERFPWSFVLRRRCAAARVAGRRSATTLPTSTCRTSVGFRESTDVLESRTLPAMGRRFRLHTHGLADRPASGKNNFRVPQPFAPALKHSRVAHLHQGHHFVLRRTADELLPLFGRVDALVIIRIIELQDHSKEFLRRLQDDLVLPAKQFCFKPLNHTSDTKGFSLAQ